MYRPDGSAGHIVIELARRRNRGQYLHDHSISSAFLPTSAAVNGSSVCALPTNAALRCKLDKRKKASQRRRVRELRRLHGSSIYFLLHHCLLRRSLSIAFFRRLPSPLHFCLSFQCCLSDTTSCLPFGTEVMHSVPMSPSYRSGVRKLRGCLATATTGCLLQLTIVNAKLALASVRRAANLAAASSLPLPLKILKGEARGAYVR